MGMRNFFNGLVNARMVELESEHINATEDSKWNPSEDNIRKGFSFDEGNTAQLKLRRFTEILCPDGVPALR